MSHYIQLLYRHTCLQHNLDMFKDKKTLIFLVNYQKYRNTYSLFLQLKTAKLFSNLIVYSNLLKLAVYLDRNEFRNKAERILCAFGNKSMDSLIVFPQMVHKLKLLEYYMLQVRASASTANNRVFKLQILLTYFCCGFFFSFQIYVAEKRMPWGADWDAEHNPHIWYPEECS